jgi:Mrp family chromosome partitioning ATPase
MILRDLWTILGRRRTLVLLVTAVIVAIGAWAAFSQDRTYRSSAGLSLLPSKNPTAGYSRNAELFLNTYADGLRDDRFSETVASSVSFPISSNEVEDDVSLEPSESSATIVVSARRADPDEALELATVAGDVAASEAFNPDLENFKISVISEPKLPGSPEGAGPVLTLLAWLMGGVILGVAVALAYDRLVGEVRAPGDVERVTEVPVAALLPDLRSTEIAVGGPAWPRVQALRTDVLYRLGGGGRTIAVMGLSDSSGASEVAANLAVAAAQVEDRVMVVDANPAAPVQHQLFGVSRGNEPRTTAFDGLRVWPVGDTGRSPERILRSLGDAPPGGVVVIDAPPVESELDGRVFAAVADGLLLVVRLGEANEGELRAAVEGLSGFPAPLVGIVLTGAALDGAPEPSAADAVRAPAVVEDVSAPS